MSLVDKLGRVLVVGRRFVVVLVVVVVVKLFPEFHIKEKVNLNLHSCLDSCSIVSLVRRRRHLFLLASIFSKYYHNCLLFITRC